MIVLPRLYAIVDHATSTRHGWDVCELARAYLEGGARLLQVRAPHVSSRDYLAWCDRIIADASRVDARVVVNDRPDIAALSGAAGVHLGQTDLSPDAARRVVAAGSVVGLSTHTRHQLDRAIEAPVDYVAVGPVFPTRTKDTGYSEVGLDLVSYGARLEPAWPVVAIGGVSLERARETIEAGAASVAVITDLLAGGDPARRVADYVRVLETPSKYS